MLNFKRSFGGLGSNPVTGGPRLSSEIPQSVPLLQPPAKHPRHDHDCSDPLPERKPSSSKEYFQLDNKDFMCMVCGGVLEDPHIGSCGHNYYLTVLKILLNVPSVTNT